MIKVLESIISELNSYKEKLEQAQTRYIHFKLYLKERNLEPDFEQWQVEFISLRGFEFLEKTEAAKEQTEQDFKTRPINPN